MLFQEKWTMSDIALTVSILALVAVVGLFIGNVKFRGVGLGIGGVLFGGIIVGHFVSQAGMTLSSDMLHVIQEFGLILFVYTIGIQVGPGFFASLRVSGLRLNRAGGRAADLARPGDTDGDGRSNGDELCDGVSIWDLRHFVHYVDAAGYFPRQC